MRGATAYQAKQQGYHLVADGEGLIKAIIAVAVRQDFYDANKDVIERFMKAQEEIASFMQENQDETLNIVAQELDLDEEAVKEMYGYYDFPWISVTRTETVFRKRLISCWNPE